MERLLLAKKKKWKDYISTEKEDSKITLREEKLRRHVPRNKKKGHIKLHHSKFHQYF